ncbi:putative membrane protein [Mycolicibacterium chubuense NBB4]|uniref:Putative membrane protein n=1 Tax=Mycolicibacterium chubuense (strain NBB4) TaxID=710421 RepID=I4BJZ0_MYCCN|nr:FUSC family protein [Mycolicibacterium chubuense]AFM17597.1 putative membrane protein [Mycolicibacterium chubuense NBB4]
MIKGLGVRLSLPDVAAVLRSLLAIAVMAVVAMQWGPAGSVTAVAGAAAIAAATALQDDPRGRIPLVVGVSFLMGSAVLVGALTSAYSPVFIVVAGLWCFGAAMPWALGATAGLIATASGVLLVTAAPDPPTWSSTVGTCALAVAAGLLQAAVIAVRPPRRWRDQRDALAVAYSSLAADARRLADGDLRPVDTRPLVALREAFVLTDGQTRRRPAEYRSWYAVPERIGSALTDVAARQGSTGVLAAAAETLEAVADPRRGARADADAAIRRLDKAAAESPEGDSTAVARLCTQVHEAVAYRLGDFLPSTPEVVRIRRPELRTSVRSSAALIRSHLDRHSPVLRHAVRLGTAVAVGCAFERYTDVAHGYWVALAVLLVLRPETAHTYTRCVGRLGATLVGIAVAAGLLFVLDPVPLVSTLLAVVSVGIAFAAAEVGYLALSATLAATVVFLIAAGGHTATTPVSAQLVGALLGGGLAVLAHVLLPDDVLTRLAQRAGELLKTEIDYAAMVIKAYVQQVDHPTDALSAAWQRAFRARAAFEAAAGASRLQSRDLRHWLRSYRTALNAITGSCAALEDNLRDGHSAVPDHDFALAVDEYVESLCGNPPTPARPWTVDMAELTAAGQRLRDAASRHEAGATRVLVAEIWAISRNLTALAVTPGPTAAR